MEVLTPARCRTAKIHRNDTSKAPFTRSVFQPVIQNVKKWVLQYPMEVFTHNVKICQKDQRYYHQKRAKNATCKQCLSEDTSFL